MRWAILAASTLALAACGLSGNPPLVSGASPAFANNVNSEPQSINSLPPNAAGLQSSGPNNNAPNYFHTGIRGF